MKICAALLASLFALVSVTRGNDRPHVVFVMADDMGWGQTSYNGHPLLKTTHLDAIVKPG